MIIRTSGGARIKGATTVWSIWTWGRLMCTANVEICFVLSAVRSLTGHVIVQLQRDGEKRTQTKVKISLGLWPTQSNAPNVENPLRRIKDVTI